MSPKQVSFIAALFKSASDDPNNIGENSTINKGENVLEAQKDSKQDDFLFALFIAQEPDPQLLTNQSGSSPNKQLSNNTSKVETEETEKEESEVGHFCAPFSPGFCEANFCIFHNPRQVENE